MKSAKIYLEGEGIRLLCSVKLFRVDIMLPNKFARPIQKIILSISNLVHHRVQIISEQILTSTACIQTLTYWFFFICCMSV